MSLRLGNDRVQAVAAFQSRHRAEMLSVVFTELVGMTALREERGDSEALGLRRDHDMLVREVLSQHAESLEVSAYGDRFFLAFSKPSVAVLFAVRLQVRFVPWARQQASMLGEKMAIHVGEVLVETSLESGSIHGLNGLEVDRCERVLGLAEPGRILMTRPAFDMARTALQGMRLAEDQALQWYQHGSYGFAGLGEPMEVCEVSDPRMGERPPPEDTATARRLPPPEAHVIRISRARWVMGALLAAIVGAALLPFPDGLLSTLSYDLAYYFRKPERNLPEAVIIALDEASYHAAGVERNAIWDRALHAEMVERLTECGARAIVLDFIFRDAGASESQREVDARLVSAVRASGRVVVAASESRTPHGVRLEPPFEPLRNFVRWGGVHHPSADDVTRQAARRRFFARETLPSLPGELARLLNVEIPGVDADQGWLNYYGPPGTIEVHSYHEVLSGLRQGNISDRFQDRVVCVGADRRGMQGVQSTDLWKTPYSLQGWGRSPGVEVVATECLNVLRGDGLRRLHGLVELGIVMVTGLGIVGLVAKTRPLAGLGSATVLSVVMACGCMGSVWWTGVWFPWAIVCLVQVPIAVGWCTLARLDARVRAGLTQVAAKRRKGFSCEVGSDQHGHGTSAALPKGEGSAGRGHVESDLMAFATARVHPAGPEVDPSATLVPTPVIPDYEVLRLIGEGGFGEVWLCRSTSGIYRAVKVVRRAKFGRDKPYEQEFAGIRQYEPVSLSHGSLLAILHVGRRDSDGYFFYVMELGDDAVMPGTVDPGSYEPRNLAKDIQRLGRLPVGDCIRLGEELAGALEVLHGKGLLHRDIKPANVIFLKGVPKLADIGLVTLADRGGASMSFVGTIGYIAPEGPRSIASDIFSLGKVLYEASTGISASEFPALPSTLLEREDCGDFLRLNEIVLRACDLDPKERHASAAELKAALGALRQQLGNAP